MTTAICRSEELLATAGLVFEEANDVARAASRYRKDGAGFADLMILAAAARTNVTGGFHERKRGTTA